MTRRLTLTLALLALYAANMLVNAQESGDGLKLVDIARSRRIFEGEQATLARLKTYSPVFETYIQSLWPDTPDQVPLGDALFLGKVRFYELITSRGEDIADMLFPTLESRNKVLADNGQYSQLLPKGFIWMSVIDPDFDADTYRLTFLRSSPLEGKNCLVFNVSPIKAKKRGRFTGTLWVEPTNFRIVRANGTVWVPRVAWKEHLKLFGYAAPFALHFDTWRQEIEPGLWVPAYVLIDDNVPWKAIGGDGATDHHFKSITIFWGYSHVGAFEHYRRNLALGASAPDPQVVGLEGDALIAPPGEVESSLQTILAEISQASQAALPSDISIRILMTTSAEIFHIGHTIIVSRGLLELVPDDDVLAGLLAHELAHVVSDRQLQAKFDYSKTLFQEGRSEEFAGLGLKGSAQDENEAAALTCDILVGKRYEAGVGKAAAFVKQLATAAGQIPSLARAHFGIGLIEHGRDVHTFTPCLGSHLTVESLGPLQLRGRYLVDTLTGRLHPGPTASPAQTAVAGQPFPSESR